MKFPEGQPIRWRTIWAVVILRTDIKVRATSGRRCLSIERARQKAVANYVCRGRWSEKAHDRRVGITSQSLGAVQRISAYVERESSRSSGWDYQPEPGRGPAHKRLHRQNCYWAGTRVY